MGQESVSNEQQARSKKKRHSQPGLKLVIRRLPVGLTEAQLHAALDSHAWSKHVDRVQFIPGNERCVIPGLTQDFFWFLCCDLIV